MEELLCHWSFTVSTYLGSGGGDLFLAQEDKIEGKCRWRFLESPDGTCWFGWKKGRSTDLRADESKDEYDDQLCIEIEVHLWTPQS